jgi:hypothetical protein
MPTDVKQDDLLGALAQATTCHILPHAESEHGMFGMVTALVVEK